MSPARHESWYFSRRLGAAIIDYVIYGALCFLYVRYFGSETAEGYQVTGCTHLLVIAGAWIIWLPLPEAIVGRTFGKWAVDLRVVGIKGQAASAGEAFLRRVLDPIDLLFFFGLVALVVAKTNPQAQRLGDLIAKTRVINDAANDTSPVA